MINKTIGVLFLDGVWQIHNIMVADVPDGTGGSTGTTPLNLDNMFVDRSTSVRFKGYGQQGRMLYVETNQFRKHPQDLRYQDCTGSHLIYEKKK